MVTLGAVFADITDTLKLSNMRPTLSEWSMVPLRAVQRERKAWRVEKLGWYSLQVTMVAVVFIALFLVTGLQAPM